MILLICFTWIFIIVTKNLFINKYEFWNLKIFLNKKLYYIEPFTWRKYLCNKISASNNPLNYNQKIVTFVKNKN